MVNGPEYCDGAPPQLDSCKDFGYDAGPLGCSPFCSPGFDACIALDFRWVNRASDAQAIWARAKDDVVVVGASEIWHWNGAKWLDETPAAAAMYRNVSGTANVAFAVGDAGAIVQRQGATWAAATSPTTEALYGVWIGADDLGFAVGANSTIVKWNGTAWSPVTSPIAASFQDVAGSAANSAYAVG